MIAYGENIQVFCGNSNPQFAQTICKELGVPMGKAIVTHFADGEASADRMAGRLPALRTIRKTAPSYCSISASTASACS